MNYSLRQLEVLVTVVQEKGFNHAGERTDLSQSAVGRGVKELENHTGVRPLDRTTREVVLTDAGQQLALCLERLLDKLNDTLRDTGCMGQQLSGKVRAAANQTISAHLIPQCTAESHRCYPDIQFTPYDHPQQWVTGNIRREDVDFGIATDPGPVGDLQREVILSEPFFLLCHRDSASAVEDYAPWQALQGVKSVLQDYTSGSWPLIDAALARSDIQANTVQEIGHPAALLPMVATGIGISIPPTLALLLPEGSSLVVKHTTPMVERQLMLICRKSRSLPTVAEVLWDIA